MKVMFLPLPFKPSDREALMALDKSLCEPLQPMQEFARPAVSWEFPENHNPTMRKPNVTIVRKITDEMRIRGYAYVAGLDSTKMGIIEIRHQELETCILCGAPAAMQGLYMSDKPHARYSLSGSSVDSGAYGLCQKCFDLPDKIERVEKKLGIIP